MIEFSIPDFYQQSELNSILIYLMEQQPNCFYDNIRIGSIFGSFPCIWNGGRGAEGIYNKSQVIDIISFFNKNHMEIRHTFTNRFIKETDKYDHVCNQICEITEQIGQKYNVQNSCNVYHNWLGQYIKETYPKLNIIYSTTKELQTVDQINKYSENNLVIPSYNINHNIDLLKRLKYPENIELLCVETGCRKNCPHRIIHQDYVSSIILQIDSPERFVLDQDCPLAHGPWNCNWYGAYDNPDVYISFKEMNEIYLPLKFNKFKISGRGPLNSHTIVNLESYINLFVKPEYKDYMRLEILEKFEIIRQCSNIGCLYM